MSLLSIISDLTSFGAAGLMGAMWLIERRLSRRRESQLDDAHDRICRDEKRLDVLTDVVGRNNAAIVKFLQHQQHQTEILKHLVEDMHHGRIP
jgi:hypothetical protein